jgi:predicted kinase
MDLIFRVRQLATVSNQIFPCLPPRSCRAGQALLICGPPGCGKSTLTQILSPKLNAISLSSDSLHGVMYPRAARVSTGDFTPEALEAIYCCFEPLIRILSAVAPERPIIVEGSFRFRSQQAAVTKLCQTLRLPCRLVVVTVNDDVLVKHRLRIRRAAGEPGDYRHYLKTKSIFEVPANAYVIDNSGSREALCEQADRLICSLQQECVPVGLLRLNWNR